MSKQASNVWMDGRTDGGMPSRTVGDLRRGPDRKIYPEQTNMIKQRRREGTNLTHDSRTSWGPVPWQEYHQHYLLFHHNTPSTTRLPTPRTDLNNVTRRCHVVNSVRRVGSIAPPISLERFTRNPSENADFS